MSNLIGVSYGHGYRSAQVCSILCTQKPHLLLQIEVKPLFNITIDLRLWWDPTPQAAWLRTKAHCYECLTREVLPNRFGGLCRTSYPSTSWADTAKAVTYSSNACCRSRFCRRCCPKPCDRVCGSTVTRPTSQGLSTSSVEHHWSTLPFPWMVTYPCGLGHVNRACQPRL
ncbi:hypothetical protein BD289DRAFT_61557 [Coniella lustricola]|uniref:Uncharacterized protein n=1 Tax=Coniella lustricola TaxID=2025994 RepID=A0A2T3A0H2_9PEZI|nr:hypothetical protein BD289DRAFT_61557 [Coniella lustricola]